MTIELLTQHQLIFSIQSLLSAFYVEFPIDEIRGLRKEEYVLGRLHLDEIETFCYWMEKKLENFGKISGSNASQYGIYYGKYGKNSPKEYRFTKKYGNDFDVAFKNLKTNISELLELGVRDDYKGISLSMLPDKFKGKLLATYFPEKYLSIYSKEYLDEVLMYFNLDDEDSLTEKPIYNQIRLIKWKDDDDIMKSWSLMKFAMFINHELYTYLYNATDDNERDKVPKFPEVGNLSICFVDDLAIDKDFLNPDRKSNKPFPPKKTDYEKLNLRNKAIGDRGEHIAKLWEEMYLNANGRPDLAKKVKWVSKETDGLGYDILSYSLDNKKKFIEVKSTNNKKADPNFFITSFELSQSKALSNYSIYYVFDILSLSPKIWDLGNPFFPKIKGVAMKPTQYKVTIKSKKISKKG